MIRGGSTEVSVSGDSRGKPHTGQQGIHCTPRCMCNGCSWQRLLAYKTYVHTWQYLGNVPDKQRSHGETCRQTCASKEKTSIHAGVVAIHRYITRQACKPVNRVRQTTVIEKQRRPRTAQMLKRDKLQLFEVGEEAQVVAPRRNHLHAVRPDTYP